MLSPGRIPKRDEERIRRNKPDVPTTKIPTVGEFKIPALGIANAHPLVRDLYNSMKKSGQSQYMEPSDWEYARITMYALNDLLTSPSGIGAMKLQAVNQMMSSLLLTEGDRRRARMEVERVKEVKEDNVVNVSDLFRQRLEQAQ